MNIHPNLKWIYIYSVCNYNEFCYAELGKAGLYTLEGFHAQRVRPEIAVDEVELVGPHNSVI